MPQKGLTSPEGILMLCVAVLLDLTGFAIFIFGTWFAIDDYGILEVIGVVIIGTWMFMRYGPFSGDSWSKTKEEYGEGKRVFEESETVKGSGDAADWKKNDKGAYELKEGKGMAKPSTKGKQPTAWKNPKEMAKDQVKELAKKALKRFGLNFIVELLPFLGGFWPGWTIIVYKEMKE